MAESDHDVVFNDDWAVRKLDMVRRSKELDEYIEKNLPELEDLSGIALDIGCGPGDFLARCRNAGLDILGIEAPGGHGGMGDAYLYRARCLRDELIIPALEVGLKAFIQNLSPAYHGKFALINSRGSIEQASAHVMIGPPHHEHHDCRLLDWDENAAMPWFDQLMENFSKMLYPGGKLLIQANGTKSTDSFYDYAVLKNAQKHGLRLEHCEPKLLHKWVKP